MTRYTDYTLEQKREYHRVKQRQYAVRNPQKIKEHTQTFKYKKYGLTELTFKELLKKQENL